MRLNAGVLIAALLPSILPFVLPFAVLSQPDAVKRPKILGVAHVALYVSDLAKARTFYEGFLGFDEEPFTLKKGDGSERIVFVKINDTQYLELFAEEPKNDGRLNHISIYTDNADRLHAYLAARGVKVPDKVGKGQVGNRNFNVKDPDDHTVEIVEYQPDSWTTREAGKHMPDTRISTQIMHAGFLVGDLDASLGFYNGILGFTEFWRGSGSGTSLSWVNMRVPDGGDYVELMLYSTLPAPEDRGTKNHVSLMVPDAQKAVEELKSRAARGLYGKDIAAQVGVNRKRQVNLFDPDGTRIELMEPNTIDGKPAPSSPAPPPRPGQAQARVEGIAHMAYYVSDMNKARAYFEDFLGFEEAFALKNPDGTDHVAFVKINDRQFIELFLEPPTNHGFLRDVAFWTADAGAVRESLTARGLAVSAVTADMAGDLGFGVTDPFGFNVQIVQYQIASRTGVTSGTRMPGTRISDHIDHVGVLIGDRDAATRFYADTFGFVAEGDGSKQRIGAGPDRFELGFERKPPTVDRFHVKNHICLSVPDVPKIAAMLQAKPAAKRFRAIETHVLDNGKHVAELYDLDGNRVELMEPPKGTK